MVHVEFRLPLAVHERRDLVHQITVIVLIVGIRGVGPPALFHQPPLDTLHFHRGHENVEIHGNAATRRRKCGLPVGGTLEQHDLCVQNGQNPTHPVDFISKHDSVRVGLDARMSQLPACRFRQVFQQAESGEVDLQPAKQPMLPSDVQNVVERFGTEPKHRSGIAHGKQQRSICWG